MFEMLLYGIVPIEASRDDQGAAAIHAGAVTLSWLSHPQLEAASVTRPGPSHCAIPARDISAASRWRDQARGVTGDPESQGKEERMNNSRGTEQEQAQQDAAIYGTAARYAEHQPGQSISFTDPENGQPGTGTLLYVRTPGATYAGGPEHPTVYIVDDGRGFPRALYAGDIKG